MNTADVKRNTSSSESIEPSRSGLDDTVDAMASWMRNLSEVGSLLSKLGDSRDKAGIERPAPVSRAGIHRLSNHVVGMGGVVCILVVVGIRDKRLRKSRFPGFFSFTDNGTGCNQGITEKVSSVL